jgi:hypothetical protein
MYQTKYNNKQYNIIHYDINTNAHTDTNNGELYLISVGIRSNHNQNNHQQHA